MRSEGVAIVLVIGTIGLVLGLKLLGALLRAIGWGVDVAQQHKTRLELDNALKLQELERRAQERGNGDCPPGGGHG